MYMPANTSEIEKKLWNSADQLRAISNLTLPTSMLAHPLLSKRGASRSTLESSNYGK